MLKEGTDPEDGIFSDNDWKNFVLPGCTRIALVSQTRVPLWRVLSKVMSPPFYTKFKDDLATQIYPFVQELLGFKYPWYLPHLLLRCAVPGAESTPVH